MMQPRISQLLLGDYQYIVLFRTATAAPHKVVQDVHRHGEDDGGIVLGRDAAQRLEVAQLKYNGK